MSQKHKRFRMQVDLRRVRLPSPQIPEGYCWIPWRTQLLERHAAVKWQAFRREMDGQVFPCLADVEGCRRLMLDISTQASFCPGATWMVSWQPGSNAAGQDCASIQGVIRRGNTGAIQNVGVVPEHRGRGLGRALVVQCLLGFRRSGMLYGMLEVTAANHAAVNLYDSLGFVIVEVLYRDGATGETTSADHIRHTPDAPCDTAGQLISDTDVPAPDPRSSPDDHVD